jgi:hypothetical protein
VETTITSISGTIHVGRRAMDSKVGFGLKIAPKTRAKELSEPVAAGEGVAALAIWNLLLCGYGRTALWQYVRKQRKFRTSLTFFRR